ncbi:hypothetical protein D3C73_1642810 [compost metagenome]
MPHVSAVVSSWSAMGGILRKGTQLGFAYPTQLPSAENISRQYFTGYMEFEEVPA